VSDYLNLPADLQGGALKIAYESALLEAYGGSVVPEDVTARALAGMRAGDTADTELLANWFADFFLSCQTLDAASNAD